MCWLRKHSILEILVFYIIGALNTQLRKPDLDTCMRECWRVMKVYGKCEKGLCNMVKVCTSWAERMRGKMRLLWVNGKMGLLWENTGASSSCVTDDIIVSRVQFSLSFLFCSGIFKFWWGKLLRAAYNLITRYSEVLTLFSIEGLERWKNCALWYYVYYSLFLYDI